MKKAILDAIQENIPELTKEDSELIIEKFCRISPPELPKSNPPDFKLITIDEKSNTGYSIKPGNIFLNMRKLLNDSSEIVLTGVGAIATPDLIPLVALIIWNKVWSNIKIDLDENHAMAIKLMWENCDRKRQKIEENEAFQLFNQYLKSKNRNEILHDDFKRILASLESIKCIEKSGQTHWWLREWVQTGI